MKANLVLVVLLAAAGIIIAQPGGRGPAPQDADFNMSRKPLPVKPGPPAYPGEPAHRAYYRAAASYHADAVTSAIDRLREFQAGPRFKDAFTSPAVAEEFGNLVTSATEARIAMQHDLLTTATEVEQMAIRQLEVIQQMRQYQQP